MNQDHPSPAENPKSGGSAYRQVHLGDRAAAIAVLLTGSAEGDTRRVNEFLDLTNQQKIDLQNLWAYYVGLDPQLAALIVPSAGRAAMAFISPLSHPSVVGQASDLMKLACAHQDPSKVRLIQVLLEGPQALEQSALKGCGFTCLAELVYMRRRTELRPEDVPLGHNLRLLRWSESRRELFAESILRSYEQTQDCPALLGVRHIDDILAGHMAAGRFVPELWHLLMEGDQPAGVMLINLVPSTRLSELVYFGLAPSVRGRGIANQLVRRGLEAAHMHNATAMVLAVDSNNQPALRLYRRLGFVPEARKTAMILTLD